MADGMVFVMAFLFDGYTLLRVTQNVFINSMYIRLVQIPKVSKLLAPSIGCNRNFGEKKRF